MVACAISKPPNTISSFTRFVERTPSLEGPLLRVMTRKNVAWNSNAILTHLAVQQAAPANNPARLFASNDETVRAKEKYVRGHSREPPAASRVGIMHDERYKRGVLQQAEAAPFQRRARPGPSAFPCAESDRAV